MLIQTAALLHLIYTGTRLAPPYLSSTQAYLRTDKSTQSTYHKAQLESLDEHFASYRAMCQEILLSMCQQCHHNRGP